MPDTQYAPLWHSLPLGHAPPGAILLAQTLFELQYWVDLGQQAFPHAISVELLQAVLHNPVLVLQPVDGHSVYVVGLAQVPEVHIQ